MRRIEDTPDTKPRGIDEMASGGQESWFAGAADVRDVPG
jgi:hypothetical protein